jgi:hypothetical protein
MNRQAGGLGHLTLNIINNRNILRNKRQRVLIVGDVLVAIFE